MSDDVDAAYAADAQQSEADALAARYFPLEWSRVVGVTGKSKARQRLRKYARDEQKREQLRAAGSRCANCRSYDTTKIFGLKMKAHCDRQSDFHGYVEAKPDGLCIFWNASSPQATIPPSVEARESGT